MAGKGPCKGASGGKARYETPNSLQETRAGEKEDKFTHIKTREINLKNDDS